MIAIIALATVVTVVVIRVALRPAKTYKATNYISNVSYTFKNEHDAQQFCDEMNRAQLTNTWVLL